MAVAFNQIPVVSTGETQIGSVSFNTLLNTTGRLITSGVSVTQVGGTDLTIASAAKTTSSVVIDNQSIAAGRAVTYQVSGQSANKLYTLAVAVSSTSPTPTQILSRIAHFRTK